MTTILSTAAVALLAERRVREVAGPMPVDELLAWLERCGVASDRAQAGVQRAVGTRHLQATVDAEDRHCVSVARAVAHAA